jgi:hypothetical protein
VTAIHSTKTVLTATPRPATSGRPVTLAVTVKNLSRNGGTPTGDVSILDGKTVLGSVALRRGQAKIKTSSLPVGRDTIEVAYSGGPDFAASTATTIETVRPPRAKSKAISILDASQSVPQVFSTAAAADRGMANPTEAVTLLGDPTVLGTLIVDQASIITGSDIKRRRRSEVGWIA